MSSSSRKDSNADPRACCTLMPYSSAIAFAGSQKVSELYRRRKISSALCDFNVVISTEPSPPLRICSERSSSML